jgi:hypothetical protein
MNAYRVYLDTLLVDEPIGLSDIEITIERDAEIRGLLVKFTSELGFIGSGYDALITKRDEGILTITDVLIQYQDSGVWKDLFEGIIFTADMSYNLTKKIATATVEDNSFTARINNNKNIDASFDVGKSKNGETITAVTPVDIDFFDPVDNLATYFYPDIKCYKVFDCLEFIIAFMTDGNVGFESDFFDTGGDGSGYMITTGKILSGTDADDALVTNFEDLFNELSYRFNLSFSVSNASGSPVVKIEPNEDFYLEQDSVTLDNPKEILQTVDRARLYSNIEFGNNVYTEYNTLDNANYPTIPFFGHQEESYHVLGEANIDNTLTLTGSWSVDSNSIEQAIVGTSGTTTSTSAGKLVDSGASFNNGSVAVAMKVYNLTDGTSTTIDAIDSATQLDLAADIFTSSEDYKIASRTDFDDAIFIIQTDYPTNARATKNDDFFVDLAVYVYNVLLNNYNVSINYFGAIQNSIASFLAGDTENASAAITSSSGLSVTTTSVIKFNDVVTNGYDTGGNYVPASGRYTVAVGEGGAYSVGCLFDYFVPFSPGSIELGEVYLRQYNTGGTLLRERKIATITGLGNIFNWTGGSSVFYANETDYFTVEYDETSSTADWTITQTYVFGATTRYSSFFIFQIASAEIAQTYNPEDFRGFLYDFNYPITFDEWDNINSGLTKRIAFTAGTVTYKGWIEKITYNHRRRNAVIKLANTN